MSKEIEGICEAMGRRGNPCTLRRRSLKCFTEFWRSDNTDLVERLFIQWGFSQILPAKAMDAHVTSWNKKTSVKFRTDVASMNCTPKVGK